MEHGNGLISQCHVGAAHALVLPQLVETRLLQLLQTEQGGKGVGEGGRGGQEFESRLVKIRTYIRSLARCTVHNAQTQPLLQLSKHYNCAYIHTYVHMYICTYVCT